MSADGDEAMSSRRRDRTKDTLRPLPSVLRARLFRTLQARFFLALALIGLLPLGLVGLGGATLEREEHVRHAGHELTGLVRVLADQLDIYVVEMLNDTRMIAALPEVVSMDPPRQDVLLKEIYHQYPVFERLSTFDRSGRRIASSHPTGAPSIAERESFKTAAERGRLAWEVAPSLSTGRPALLIHTPIRDADRRVVGVAGAVVDLDTLSALVRGAPIGGDGRAFVLDATGRILLHPDLPAVQERRDYSWLLVPTGGHPAGPSALRYEQDGQAWIAGYAPMPNVGWTVVVERPEAEVLVPVERAWRLALISLVLSALFALAAATLLARTLTRPLRTLAATARAFGAGDPAAPLPKLTPNDGELGTLVEAFGTMRAEVAARSAALERLHAAGTLLHHTTDLETTLNGLVEHAVALAGATSGILALRNADELVARHSFGLSPDQVAAGRLSIDGSIAGLVYRTARPIVLDDPADPRLDRALAAAWDIRTLLVVPLASREGMAGVLAVHNKRTGTFTAEDARLLTTLAGEVAIVLENAELTRRAAEVEALRELSHQKSFLLATVSHELKTPLTLIQGFSELICTRDLKPEQMREMCHWINDGALRLSRVVDDIISFSEIESGRVKLQLRSVAVDAAVKQSLDIFVRGRRPITADLPPDLPPVLADPGRLQQILTNLVGNALKFSPAEADVSVSARAADGHVRVAVRDAGPGVPVTVRERIFEPFYRTEESHRQAVPGTGLGLAIAKQLVVLHGGQIAVDDAPGGGSIFSFTLPAVPRESAP